MPNKDSNFHEAPEKGGGEGWLYSEQQQKSNGNATAPLNSLAEWRQPNESRTHT